MGYGRKPAADLGPPPAKAPSDRHMLPMRRTYWPAAISGIDGSIGPRAISGRGSSLSA